MIIIDMIILVLVTIVRIEKKIAGRYILFLGGNGSSRNHIFYS